MPTADTLHTESSMEARGKETSGTGKEYQPDGARLHGVTWTARSDGSVEERWQTSTDAGRSWQMHFHGVFERIAE